jgi:tyrosyl-tRNA synthetase
MKIFPPLNEQMDIIRKGAEEIIPEDELVKKIEKSIANGNALRIKLGADPSRPDLHIGHAVVLGKLRDFQLLGHQAVLIIGDFTAMIGDPTGRSKTRPSLTLEETKENARSYFDQAGVILEREKLEIRYNSEWLNPMSFQDVIVLAARYTVARMLERDDFANRLKNGIPVSIHELLYPLAQAYDSVAIKSDVELGGTDQKFNLLVGRDIQKEYGMEPQVTLTMPLLVGLDGKEKMSKSLGNYIGITDTANDIYGKTLSIPDELILRYFTLTTDLHPDQIRQIGSALAQGLNPRDAKHRLAWELTRMYHSKEAADTAKNEFEKVFVDKGIPEDIEEYTLTMNPLPVANLIAESGLAPSNAEAKRLIKQGGVSINNEKITDFKTEYQFKDGDILKVGKRKFLKIFTPSK